VCCLVQIFLDPYARTMRGFCALIAKEWCAFGHKFQERAGHMLDKDDGDISPVFTQFLDAVWQLVRLFPRAFEFNARLPLLLAHHLYACRFGTFLFNNERERAEAAVEARTASLWAYVLGGGPVTDALRAREYDPAAGDVLLPVRSALMRGVTLWTDWFARYAPYPTMPISCAAMETYDAAFYDRAALNAARLPPRDAAAPPPATAAAASDGALASLLNANASALAPGSGGSGAPSAAAAAANDSSAAPSAVAAAALGVAAAASAHGAAATAAAPPPPPSAADDGVDEGQAALDADYELSTSGGGLAAVAAESDDDAGA